MFINKYINLHLGYHIQPEKDFMFRDDEENVLFLWKRHFILSISAIINEVHYRLYCSVVMFLLLRSRPPLIEVRKQI